MSVAKSSVKVLVAEGRESSGDAPGDSRRTAKISIAAICLCLCFAQERSVQAETAAQMPTEHRDLFVQYCYECHDAATEEGSVNLEDLTFDIAKDIETAEKWAKVLGVINSGEMPPEDSPPLPDADKAAFLQELSGRMVTARRILSDTGGEITMRRLNRREYANTIEALLGVRPDVSDLPDDQGSAGFDTAGASLFFSSDQLEQYLAAARRSLRLVMNAKRTPKSRTTESRNKESKTVRIEPEHDYNERYAAAAEQMRDSSRRSKAFLAQTERPASDYGILDAYSAKKKQVAEWLPLLEGYLARPETKTGATLIMTIKQGGYTRIKFPALHAHDDGNYVIRVRAAAYPGAEDRLHYLEFTGGQGNARKLLGWRKVIGTLDQPQIIEFPISHGLGQQNQIQVHQRSHQDRADKNLAFHDRWENGIGTPPGLWIDWAEMVGPETTVTPRAGSLDDLRYEDVRASLRRFATEVFRGAKPDEDYLDRLVVHYQAGLDQGLKPSEAIIDPLAIVLSSPSFLYLVESKLKDSSGRKTLTSQELASRLSYLLWSGPPDDELMRLAFDGRLRDAHVLQKQTERMLSDRRADRFVRHFIRQWLEIERIDMFQFNGVQFRKFDNAVRASAREEIYQTVHHLIDEKLPLGTLLQSDFVVINDLMADYYDIVGVDGHEFRAVPVADDSIRGGLLGTAAFSAMGSDGVRSSPVERGAWVLRHLLNDPPPPAPPNVPQLSRLAGQHLSARALANAHQEQPQCNQCHQKIDPIGFGLENLDASGQWRDEEVIGIGKLKYGKWTRDKRFAIDPKGTLPSGESFADFIELRQSIARHEDAFARGFTEALIAYGLGRPYGFTDDPLAESILQKAKQKRYPISEFIHALVQSPHFQSK